MDAVSPGLGNLVAYKTVGDIEAIAQRGNHLVDFYERSGGDQRKMTTHVFENTHYAQPNAYAREEDRWQAAKTFLNGELANNMQKFQRSVARDREAIRQL